MNTFELMNKTLYPQSGNNARSKEYPYFDTLAITAGTLEYFFFNTALGNIFARNKRLPLSGSEIFFVNAISATLGTQISSPAGIDALNEMLQQSYLAVSVDNRLQMKIPGLDFIQYTLNLNEDATPEILSYTNNLVKRNLPMPILMNSTSAFEFKFVTTAAAATFFNAVNFRLHLHGVQVDKLEPMYFDNLKNNKFQQIAVTYYDTVAITGAAQDEYTFFNNPAKLQNLFSGKFPLSEIQTLQIQNIEVFVNQPDVPVAPFTIYNSRLTNNLRIRINDVDYYNSNLQDCLSVVAGLSGSITDSAAATVAYNQHLNIRQSKTFQTPLNVPGTSNCLVALTQPAASIGITGEITVVLRGVETRRVA